MKICIRCLTVFIIAIVASNSSFAQSVNETEIEVKLYLPAHLKNEIKSTDKLEVFFIAPSTGMKVPTKVVAKKVKDNVYTFKMPNIRFMQIGFSIGVYRCQMNCINNKNGTAQEDYYFDLHLEKSNVDYNKPPQFLRPCPLEEGEEE